MSLDRTLVADAAAYADRWLGYQQRLQRIPAVTAALRLDDELLLSGAYGHADLERGTPVATNHVFRIASHSKWFTGVALMQLKEQGKLRLDDPIGAYVDWLEGPAARLTVRQVANHAGGLTRDGYDADHWQLLNPPADEDELKRLVANEGVVTPPDRKLKYSNVGFCLLGLVVRGASGTSYENYVRANIVEPLGLETTGPELPDALRDRLAVGYTSRSLLVEPIAIPHVPAGATAAAFGWYATAEELTRFGAAQFVGADGLLSDDAKRELQRPYWPIRTTDSYGIGVHVWTVGARRMFGHAGGGFPGAGHTTRTLVDPDDRLVVSVLTSEAEGVAMELVDAIVRLVDLACAHAPARDTKQLDRFTGRFGSLGGVTDVVRLGGSLFAIEPRFGDPAGAAFPLRVEDDSTLRFADVEGYGPANEAIRYTWDGDGRAAAVRIAGRTHVPEAQLADTLERRRAELAAR